MSTGLSPGEMYLFALLGLIGIGALAAGLYLRWRAAASRNWPSVMGRVVATQVRVEVLPMESTGDAYSRYYPEVEYEYTVDGHTYRSKRIRFGGLPFVYSTDRGEIEAWLAEYPVGKKVQVYYNPQHPSEAVLEPGASPAALILLVVGGISLLALAAVLLRSLSTS